MAKTSEQVLRADLEVEPSDQRTSAGTGMSCLCGCGATFTPRDERQRYLPGHRFKTYAMHRCPSCGVQHREGAKKE